MLELVCRIARSFELPPVQIEIQSFAPAGSGLGGSSVIAIALVAALSEFTQKNLSQEDIIEWAKSIETQAIKVPTGYQDYWAAVYGGTKAYSITLTGKVSQVSLGSEEFRQRIEECLMLVYTGKPHSSGPNNWELFKQHIDGINGIPDFFEQLKNHGSLMQDAFATEDITAVAKVLNEDWRVRKSMLPTMTTPEIETLTERSFAAGAMALRVCGAGAGGCAVLLVEPDRREAVAQVVAELGMTDLGAKLRSKGVVVTRS
jgi:D-glycero-alpha-D-manno-heptose-7-phosphate kinase